MGDLDQVSPTDLTRLQCLPPVAAATPGGASYRPASPPWRELVRQTSMRRAGSRAAATSRGLDYTASRILTCRHPARNSNSVYGVPVPRGGCLRVPALELRDGLWTWPASIGLGRRGVPVTDPQDHTTPSATHTTRRSSGRGCRRCAARQLRALRPAVAGSPNGIRTRAPP